MQVPRSNISSTRSNISSTSTRMQVPKHHKIATVQEERMEGEELAGG